MEGQLVAFGSVWSLLPLHQGEQILCRAACYGNEGSV
jgi:hypothetical protein